ncbi:MAG: HAD family hydrolase [Oscillibacter sp.]|nr:HAD family hydrolase [Oscillibacter sp.]
MWNTILFDLDGTLTDSAPGITNSVAHALARFGIREEPKNLLKFVGPPLNESLAEFYGFSPQQTAEAIAVFREYFVEKGWCENAPYPGIGEVLRELKAAGLRLMVATSKPEVQAVRILKHFGLADYFEQICGAPLGNEDGARKSAVIRQALSYVGGETASAVMVGDRRHDVAGAHETGLPCVGVLYGYGGREELEKAGAEYIAEDMAALKELLLKGGKDGKDGN